MDLKKMEQYGKFATWAVWNNFNTKERLTNCIYDNEDILHNRFVLIGLNASCEVDEIWMSFRCGKHDRKLKYAFNDYSPIQGSYITDLFKIVDVKSHDLRKKLQKNPKLICDNVLSFRKEMEDLGINSYSSSNKFLIFGNMANYYYTKHFANNFPKIDVIKCRHYSARGTDKDWVENTRKTIGCRI